MSHSGTLSQSQMHHCVLQFFLLLIYHHITLLDQQPTLLCHAFNQSLHSIALPPSGGRLTEVTKQALDLWKKTNTWRCTLGRANCFGKG